MNNCATIGFDALGFFNKLKDAGIPEAQARIQAEAFKEYTEQQANELHNAIKRYDEAQRREIATRGDVHDVRLEIERVRGEVERVRGEVEKVKYDLLKWMIGMGIALVTVMVTGFGTLGVIMAKALNWSGF